MELIGKKENIFGDNIAFLEHYDFSKANMNEENRILAVTGIASICYNNPKNVGSESLYNRLMTEAHSLPSSSAEFVPVLLTQKEITSLYFNRKLFVSDNNLLTKFGEWIKDGEYLLTNFRAVVYLFEKFGIDFRGRFNTEEECEIIKQHFKVFKYYIDLPTRSQMVRHRVNWQELCVTGDTELQTSKGKFNIKELYEKQEELKDTGNYKKPLIKSYDFENDNFFQAPVKEIFKTGKKEVFEVTIQHGTKGKTYKIKTSAEHKFLTKDGWKRLKDIELNSYLAINGQNVWRSYDWCKNKKEKYLANGKGMKDIAIEENINYNTLKKWFHRHKLQYTPKEVSSTFDVWNKGIKGEDSHTFGRVHSIEIRQKISDKHTKPLGSTNQVYAKRIRSYWEADFRRREILAKYENKCSYCGSESNLELDHKLPVCRYPELGFDADNVHILCCNCHKEKSKQEIIYGKYTIKYGMLISVKSLGEEETYDLEVDHKDHNYVANGIIVHNSRRYVSGKRAPFEFYISDKMKEVMLFDKGVSVEGSDVKICFTAQDLNDLALKFYNQALESGVKPQEARRIIPQSAYSLIWGAFQPTQYANFMKLRDDSHAQWEISQVAKAMKELIQ